jgi:phenol 2-monooxygenase
MSQPSSSSSKTSVVIAGSGSAGLCAALWLSIYKVPYRILDSRSGPLEVGQADGVQCRTVEIFESFGLADELRKEAYWVNEVTFWSDGSESKISSEETNGIQDELRSIKRTGQAADTAPGLSHQPHVILNQARINGLMLGAMKKHNGQEVEYGKKVLGVRVDISLGEDVDDYPVTVQIVNTNGEEEDIKTKYLIGSDGAHSSVRRSLNIPMIGDSSDSVWGVMDTYPITNFPDIRKKSVIHSAHGVLLIIPREGGSLARFYIELHSSTVPKSVTLAQLQESARRIFYPYMLEFADTYWWSGYSIGQRLAERFHEGERVFLAGDACHTHSPKAGQGMNTSLQDGYNIGWKLGQLLTGRASSSLLSTYLLERQKTAKTLIDFDRVWAKQIARGKSVGEDGKEVDFSETFVRAGRYTAGLTASYDDSIATMGVWSDQRVATGVKVGMRFPTAQVVRFCDAKAMQLVNALPSDGRWRIVVFAGDINEEESLKRLEEVSFIDVWRS